ncbi:hypothetical protein [Oceanibaculum pacificum]|uniref:Uncharacterized protein n=1 Tax=Oceanibaculum pacificum TaxID=580166 RepID=A0A154WG08_9PROT|nr:hypothetical protein [Oceanibaculum pacificum]KZD12447.1 hypothetical protein AUP43_04655 [Oceanibaculum pacificum]
MSKPHAIDICQSITPAEYIAFVLSDFTDGYDRAPNKDATGVLRFWHSINVHPECAADMLAVSGY